MCIYIYTHTHIYIYIYAIKKADHQRIDAFELW